MSKFYNVDVIVLRDALNSCKSALNYEISKEILSELSSDEIWQAQAKKRFTEALDTLHNTRYKDLEQKIDAYLQIADQIEQYQNLEIQNEKLSKQIETYNNNLQVAKESDNPTISPEEWSHKIYVANSQINQNNIDEDTIYENIRSSI